MTDPRPARSPVLLEPSLQRYAWGDARFLPELLGRPVTGAPVAEAWYGAHGSAPARTELGTPLDGHIAAEPELLGSAVREKYGRLPYLLKILAVARPLSIQVHPSADQARAGYAQEERDGPPLGDPRRRYKDPSPKPELLVALTPFEALAGFRSYDAIAATLRGAPELAGQLPSFEASAAGLRHLLEAWFELPDRAAAEALGMFLAREPRDETEARVGWVHTQTARDGRPDRGLLFVLLLEHVRLVPGEAIFLPAGLPHCYLRGAGVELMASSDNVLRAGLTPKHVDPAELLRVVRFDPGRPSGVRCAAEADGAERFAIPAEEMSLRRAVVGPEAPFEATAVGPTTLLAPEADARLTIEVEGADPVAVPPGRALFLGDGTAYRVRAEGRVVLFEASTPPPAWAAAEAIERNIVESRRLFAAGEGPAVLGTVSGSAGSRALWQRHLDEARAELGARRVLAFHEDLPVNQAFGLFLLWQRLRSEHRAGEGALVAFVFGKGTRAAPITEAEHGEKPAIRSFTRAAKRTERFAPIVELALRHFAPVEAFLRRSGFDGLVVKWGDEIQIPTRSLAGADARYANADVVRFVSLRAMTEETAAHKDWVGVDEEGRVTAFIPRRPLAEMHRLVDRRLIQRRRGVLYGGINLGSIALSRDLLELLLEEFRDEVNDPGARREDRPDLDPQLFTALTVAALDDPAARAEAWTTARSESAAMARLEASMPNILERLRAVLDRLEAKRGRPVEIRALDFGDQYWGDIGQHAQMRAFYMALADRGPEGRIARALAGIEGDFDDAGNLVTPGSRLGPGVKARGSVLLDVSIESGEIESSVLLGTRSGTVNARGAFDVESAAPRLELGPGAGSYAVLSEEEVRVPAGERATTVLLPEGPRLVRVSESAELRRAEVYGAPAFENALSFAELHERVTRADVLELQEARARLRARLEGRYGLDVGRN